MHTHDVILLYKVGKGRTYRWFLYAKISIFIHLLKRPSYAVRMYMQAVRSNVTLLYVSLLINFN